LVLEVHQCARKAYAIVSMDMHAKVGFRSFRFDGFLVLLSTRGKPGDKDKENADAFQGDQVFTKNVVSFRKESASRFI